MHTCLFMNHLLVYAHVLVYSHCQQPHRAATERHLGILYSNHVKYGKVYLMYTLQIYKDVNRPNEPRVGAIETLLCGLASPSQEDKNSDQCELGQVHCITALVVVDVVVVARILVWCRL
jgi:hypothetical protein